MWSERTPTGFKFVERYHDPMTGKVKKASVTLEKDSAANRKLAMKMLGDKINSLLAVTDNSYLTVSELMDKYTSYQYEHVKLRTYKRDKCHAEIFKDILGGGTLVSKLSARYITEALDRTGKSNVTKNEYQKHLKAALRWGYKNDYIDDISYLDKLTRYKDASAKEKVQDKYLEKDEIRKLLETMSVSRCTQWHDLTEFLILSGLRIGEAAALAKKDIRENYIHISKSYDIENGIVTSVKTLDSNREVFIQDELKAVLKRIQMHSRSRKIASPLLFYDDAGNHIHYDAYRKFLKENSLKAIGREIKPHVLRHTHASLLMANGVSIEAISRRLGHADSKITRDIYLHIMEQLRDRDNEQIKGLKIL